MKLIIQRVAKATVIADDKKTADIGKGFLILLGVTHDDIESDVEALAKKTSELRIFCDDNDKMNLSLLDVDGSAAVVSNFTLYADCSHGRRPSFTNAAAPDTANELYLHFIECLKACGVKNVQAGIFGADMKVSLLNDGPVTVILDSKEI